VFLVGGVVLAVYGINASQSLASDVSRFFTNSPTDKAVWMQVGGVVLFAIGLAGMFRGSTATE